jgi:peptidyl-prolyl cis-trans isomerase C
MKILKIAIALVSFSILMNPSFAEDRVIAKYNGKTVYKSEVELAIKSVMNGSLPNNKKDLDDLDKTVREQVVQQYVTQRVLADYANQSSMSKSDVYRQQLKIAKEQVEAQLFLNHFAKRLITKSALKSEYNNVVKALKGNDERNVSHILVSSEAVGQDLYNKIRSKQITFDQAAKENSLDGSKSNGGVIGLISRGQTVPEFESRAYSLKKGEISEPVKSQFGWHIIKVTEIKPRKIPTFDQAKKEIENIVMSKIQQKQQQKIIHKAAIEIL